MQYDDLREGVYRGNMDLDASGLVMGTFGNLSAVDRDAGVMAIKPSGMPYPELSRAASIATSGHHPTRRRISSSIAPSPVTRSFTPIPISRRCSRRRERHPLHGDDARGLFPR
jgi:hypothetical protein